VSAFFASPERPGDATAAQDAASGTLDLEDDRIAPGKRPLAVPIPGFPSLVHATTRWPRWCPRWRRDWLFARILTLRVEVGAQAMRIKPDGTIEISGQIIFLHEGVASPFS
jgi:hypothetical protein